ncbi:MAG: ImmA/IrrE family metallo-endopeptidase [Paracoccaceae bacterium]|nr:ImmA/IrrE family metallo-endopeptidase [Paracoccaceae bacterium]
MPAKHPPYPFVEPEAARLTPLEIEAVADRNAADWGFREGKSLDEVCKNAGVDIEYSHHPNEILLEAPLDGPPVVWLPRRARKRDDRVTIAKALGHWSLQVEPARKANPGCGIQALYEPGTDDASVEAMAYGMAFLMPKGDFVDAWYEGRSQAASDRFDVPTKIAYLRAEALELRLTT